MKRFGSSEARGPLGPWSAALCAVALFMGAATAGAQSLVINEIDYDQPTADDAEFVELRNNTASAVDLNDYEVRLVNGAGAAVYQTISLPAVSLATDDYYVICSDPSEVPNCDLVVQLGTDFIQDGDPDAVALYDISGAPTLVDTVSYDGSVAGFTETAGVSPGDNSTTSAVGVSRFPDGTDTGDNSSDLDLRCITPGRANSATVACTVSAIKVDAIAIDNDADMELDPGETLEYTIQITKDGEAGTGVVFSDPLDPGGNLTLVSVDTTPLAIDDEYDTIGNVGITVPAGSGVLANDLDPDGTTLAVPPITAPDTSSTLGAVVLTVADGSFTYTPPVGFSGIDTFKYTIADGEGNADTATVVINVLNEIWFLDTAAGAAGDGRLLTPFNTLAAFEAVNGNGGPTDPEMGDCIFLYTGSSDYAGGVTLENSQILVGQGASGATTLDAVCGFASLPPFSNTLPALGGVRPDVVDAAGDAVALASGNTIRGLDLGNTPAGSTRLRGTGVGALQISEVAVSGGTGRIVDIATGGPGLSMTFDRVTSTSSSGGPAIDLTGIVGSFTVSNGAGVDTSISSTATGISIQSSAATFSFGETSVGATASGIDLGKTFSNPASSFTFDSLSVTSSAGHGFRASNSGTVNIGGTGNTVDTTSGTAFEMTDTLIGGGGFTFQSISADGSGGSNVGIILDDTGTGTFTVTGVDGPCGNTVMTLDCDGGTIENIVGDGVTLNNTGGRVTFENMLFEDIGSTTGPIDTRSQHDAIHGQTVAGGLTLDNTYIRRISDQAVNGASFGDGVSATTWVGLTVTDSLIQNTNRWHVAGVADNQDEGAIRIVGLSGSADITGSLFQFGAALLELFSATSGSLTVTVTDSDFQTAYKEFTTGSIASLGRFCVSVTSESAATTTVTIGDQTDTTVGHQNGDDGNEFIDCKSASILIAHQAGATGNLDAVVANNTIRVTDHSSTLGTFGNFPQGGVALRMRGGTLDGIIEYNQFGVQVGPDDRIGSTDDEVMNAAGADGNVSLILENATGGGLGAVNGAAQVEVNNNQFNGSINSPFLVRADRNDTAAVFFHDNAYRGRDDFNSPDPFFGTFTVPGIPNRVLVRNGGELDISIEDESIVFHDQFFFSQTETIEFKTLDVGGGGTLCVALDNVSSHDGFELTEELGVGTVELFQGAVNNAATGPCTPGSTGACEAELADDLVRGGPTTRDQATGTPSPTLNPPFVDVDGGSITITGAACTKPSGGIF